MNKELIEEQAERVTSLFSYRNGHSTAKDAFIAGAEWMQAQMMDNALSASVFHQYGEGMLIQPDLDGDLVGLDRVKVIVIKD